MLHLLAIAGRGSEEVGARTRNEALLRKNVKQATEFDIGADTHRESLPRS